MSSTDSRQPIKLNWFSVCEKNPPYGICQAARFPVECGVETKEGIIDANEGDWIVQDDTGKRFVMSNDDFKALYKLIYGI